MESKIKAVEVPNVNELRINNYLQLGDGSVVHKVKAVYRTHFAMENDEGFTFNSLQHIYIGIELTEQVLLKCGFEKNINFLKLSQSFSDGNYVVDFRNGKFYFGEIELTSLHHFQNVFYFNTGKELEFKA